MSKRNKFLTDDNIDSPEEYTLPASSEEVAEIKVEEVPAPDHNELRPTRQTEYIKAKFSEGIVEIGYVFLATGEQNIVSASNGRIHLLLGRMYYIPIDKDINSDNYIIKIHSDVASRFDIRFTQNEFAAVVPLLHNSVLKTNEKLCTLIPLTT